MTIKELPKTVPKIRIPTESKLSSKEIPETTDDEAPIDVAKNQKNRNQKMR